MSAVMTESGHGVLACNHTNRDAYDPDCDVTFAAAPGESLQSAETRAAAEGWATSTGTQRTP